MVTGLASLRQPAGYTRCAMIGRTAILQVVRRMISRVVHQDESSLLMLSAESGHGKTKLLRYLAENCSELYVLQAIGTAELNPVPYSPWRSVLEVR